MPLLMEFRDVDQSNFNKFTQLHFISWRRENWRQNFVINNAMSVRHKSVTKVKFPWPLETLEMPYNCIF